MNQVIQIYGDLLFLLQFLWNMLLLFLAEKIGQYYLSRWRRGIAALFLSALSLVMLKVSQYRWGILFVGVLGLCVITRHWKLAFSYFISTAVAGGLWMIFPQKRWIVSIVGIIALQIYLKYCNKSSLYTIYCKNNEKKLKIKALWDTGNCLYTPGNHKPVSIVEYKSIAPLFNWADAAHPTVVPFSSVGKEDGILLAVQIEALIIPEKNLVIKNPYIGLVHKPLSNEGKYQMILHKDIFMDTGI